MSELRQGRIDAPDERPEAPPAPDAPHAWADGSAAADGAVAAPVDQRRAIPVQKEFLRESADREPESGGGAPHSIDWTTGESADDRTPRSDHTDDAETTPDDVTGVNDSAAETRPYNWNGGLSHPDLRDQWSIEHVVPRDADGKAEKYPDPRGEWLEYINDGGPKVDRFRRNNCLDCSMAAIATYHGNPTVSAPRTPDRRPDGSIDDSGERGGPRRAEQWLEARYENLGLGDGGFTTIEQKLREGGHGSCAAIINSWSPDIGGGAHAWNAFNDNGTIVWCDPQNARTGERPIYHGPDVRALAAICINPEGKQL